MIVVDSSVWIAHFRNHDTDAVRKLRSLAGRSETLLGDLILLEVLQGARSDVHAAKLERELRALPIETMLNASLAVQAAANYRLLRSRGVTVRKTIDMIIGTFCIEGGHQLLHTDRDFDSMSKYLGLQLA